MSDRDEIAAFLASRGVTQCASGVAYGVDKEADKAKRIAERSRREADLYASQAEHRAECAAEAFAAGDAEEGFAILSGYDRTSPGRYVSRRVRLNRF
jgi:hypothetical protein